MSYQVTFIPGDGIGPEVMSAAQRVVAATGVDVDWDLQEVGPPALAAGRDPLPAEALSSARSTGVVLKGPVTTAIGKKGHRSVNVGLRRELGMYAQVRPCRSRRGAPGLEGVDLLVIRETTEDLYAGVEFPATSEGAAAVIDQARRLGRGEIPDAAGISVKFTTEAASRRVLDFAFGHARRHGRGKVTAVHKATVMRCTDGIFLEVARDVAAANPDIAFEELQIDNLCGQIVRRPGAFDTLVMGIHYGDIVSDLAAGMVGGIGVVPGVNHGDEVVMFEPAHGTHLRLAGAGAADPTAAVLCGGLLLEHLGEVEAGRAVERAVDSVLAAGDRVTYDLRRPGDSRPAETTAGMTDAIIEALGG